MRKTVSVAEATKQETVLPERVQEALGEFVGAAREGLAARPLGRSRARCPHRADGGRGRKRGRPEGKTQRRSARRLVASERT